MKLRKIVAAALALTLAVPAMAADTADERLAKVTLAVKKTLAVEDEYTAFYGEPSDTPLGTQWSLSWSADGKELNVSATEEGKVLSMNRWEEGESYTNKNTFGPTFPNLTWAEAKSAAAAFLDRVLTQGETAVFDQETSAGSLGAESYYFRGSIDLNGLPAPLSFRVRVRVSDGAVTSFWRDDPSQYVGAVPAPTSSITAQKAAELLKTTLDLRLEYVRDGEGEKAVLRYLPEGRDDYYVDAASGKLIDLTQLREALWRGETGNGIFEAATDMSMSVSESEAGEKLSQVELEGVAKLEGVLDQEALDKLVKAWEQLGLGGFELSGCRWSVERQDRGVTSVAVLAPMVESASSAAVTAPAVAPAAEPPAGEDAAAPAKVTATLTYARRTGEGVSRRTVTVDARTGELQSMGGYNSYDETPGKIGKAAAQKKGEAFLTALWGEQFGKCELYSSTEADSRLTSEAWVFTYAQKENGYFFPANSITVRVSAGDGSIMGFSRSFDDEVVFDDAQGIISKEKALEVWAGSYPVELAYIRVPVKLDLLGEAVKPLIDAGYSYYNALKPGYELGSQEGWCQGVDAKTGALVKSETAEPDVMAYDDAAGHWAETALSELAQYNVGWWGGRAEPEAPLTQLDYVALLASADGYRYTPGEEGAADSLYAYVIRRGLLTKEEREDDRRLTRADMVKLLLDSLGYGPVAQLPDIFRCGFADADAIPAAEVGYAALAQGLGIISGDEHGNYAAARPAIRAEAAVMLWQYMKR